jgi:hypothetical protein
MKQKLALMLLSVQELRKYVPVTLVLVVLASFALILPCPATGGGPGGGV